MEFLGATVTQCAQANEYLTLPRGVDCCDNPKPAECIKIGWPQFEMYDFDADDTNRAALSWDQVREQIYCKERPFAFSWEYEGGGGHMMVAMGYKIENGTNYVYMSDPKYSGYRSPITYSWYVSSPGRHTHWNDYYDIEEQ
jgi:hypothetical protein